MGRRWLCATLLLTVGCSPTEEGSRDVTVELTESFEVSLAAEVMGEFGRVSDVEVAPDGTILVADPISRRIHCFDDRGEPIGSVGRQGQGPGEFGYLTDIATVSDRLLAFDGGAQRVTVFPLTACSDYPVEDVETFVVRTTSRSAVHEIQAMPNGDVLVQLSLPIVSYDQVSEDQRTLVTRFSSNGGVVQDSILFLPGDEWLVTSLGGGYTVSPMPFGKRSLLRVGADGALYHFWTGNSTISRFSPDGRPRESVVLPFLTSHPVRSRHLEVMRASLVGVEDFLAEIAGERFDAAVEDDLVPEWLPTASSFLVDGRGHLWLAPVTESHLSRSTSFGMVYRSPLGTPVVEVDTQRMTARSTRVPVRGRLEAVRDGRLYFVTWDDLDVESVVVFKVEEHEETR